MNQLVSHIEFLLHKHNCVIVPDMGGFVVNTVNAGSEGVATFLPPACELVFNRDLTYNDGLLAESYMRIYGISFEKAMWKIEQAVSELMLKIREHGKVDLGVLGSFQLIESNRFRYTAGEFVRPSLFGLSKFSLEPMIQMQPIVKEIPVTVVKNKNIRSVSIAAAAVAAVILMLFIFPVSDTNIGRQSAQIMYETEWMKPKAKQSAGVNGSAVIPGTDIKATAESALSSEELSDVSPKYYIIMGVFRGDKSSANLVETLKSEGFKDADCLERPGRFDVYAASFNSENAADDFLREVHKKHPNHSDAWILKR